MDEFDLSELIAQCEVYLRCFGIDPRSPLVSRILQRYDLPPNFRSLEPMDLAVFCNALKSDWEAIPIEIRNARGKTQSLMADLRLSWENEAVARWARSRGVKLSQLAIADFEDLYSKLMTVKQKSV